MIIETLYGQQSPDPNDHHPLLMDLPHLYSLPETAWHDKIQHRYPIGSKVELTRRAQAAFYRSLAHITGNAELIGNPPMQPQSELLDTLTSPCAVDIVAPVIRYQQGGVMDKTLMIMEDHLHQRRKDITMGKSTIVQTLLGLTTGDEALRDMLDLQSGERLTLSELFTVLATLDESKSTIPIKRAQPNNQKLVSGDITCIGRSHSGLLTALPIAGVKEDTMFDMARTAIRRILVGYNRIDPAIMRAQISITEKLVVDPSIWDTEQRPHTIDDVVCLTPNTRLPVAAAWDTRPMQSTSTRREIQTQLYHNPLYLASEVGFWDIDVVTHIRNIDAIMNAGIIAFPQVHYLAIRDPKDGNALEAAAQLIRDTFFT